MGTPNRMWTPPLHEPSAARPSSVIPNRVTFAVVEGSQSASAWARLEEHHAAVRDLHLRDLFAGDPARGERMTAEAAGILLDYSKHRVTDETMRLLVELAKASGLREWIDAMF